MSTTDTATAVAPRLGLARRFAGISTLGPLLALFLAGLFFSVKTDTFLTVTNISTVLGQSGYLAVLAIGQTLIILTAGIDLSVGLIMAMGAAVIAKTAAHPILINDKVVSKGIPWPLAILAGVAVCTLMGFINGVLIRKFGLPPFIVTLGMYGVLYMAVHVYLDNQTRGINTIDGLPDDKSPLTFLGRTLRWGSASITYGTLLTFLLFGLFWYILSNTRFGRHIFAFGDNPEAARLTGIQTSRLQIGVYALAGFLYGIAALVYLARIGAATPNDGQTENLETITAVVIGGTSLFGGRGTVVGSLFGAMIVFVFRNGLVQMGVRSEIQYGVTGLLLILAVAVDQYIKKKR
jgi:fructose transport system permease protein